MSTSTIENIAIGARPSTPTSRGRRRSKKTLRRLSFSIDELISPAHARAWQASIKESFVNPHAFDIILQDIDRLDSDLTNEIDNNPKAFSTFTPLLSFSQFARYQEYINAFIALFAQSKFCFGQKGHLELEITESLFVHKCPRKQVFRRLAVNPLYLADDNPENPEKVTLDAGNIPIGQLARVCDVAILKFLSNVTERTDVRSIVWALDYLAEMTKRLEVSLRTQSETGWYDIAFRKRKDTIRRSMIDVPQLAVDGRVVIGLGNSTTRSSTTTPPSFINPETGQPLVPPGVPLIAVTTETSTGSLESETSAASLSGNAPSNKPTPLQHVGARKSSEEFSLGSAPRRRYSTASKPIGFSDQSQDTPQRRSSTGSRPPGIMNPRGRKVSGTMFNHPGIDSIAEEVIAEDEKGKDKDSDETSHSSNVIYPSSFRPGLKHPLSLPIDVAPSTSSLDFPRIKKASPPVSVSPLSVSNLRSVSPMSNSKASSDELSDTESERSEDEAPVRRKTPEPLCLSQLKKLSQQDIESELNSLLTKEGRISLLGILTAIINLPSSPSLWTEDSWDACHKCFSLIQFCMDFGLESVSKESSSREPTSILRHRSMANLLEKASSTYSKLVLQYAVKALIHCAVCTYSGCSSNSCVLSSLSLQKNSRNASQNLNKMTHQLERLYSNCPLQFREVVMEFARRATLREVFHFLHVILQYCPRGMGRDPLDPSSSRKDPLIVLSAAVFRIVVDRMTLLDLKEPTVKHNIVKEAVSFVHYVATLFDQDFISNKGFHHLHQYVQRVAFSVLLPVTSPAPPAPVKTSILVTPPPLDIPEMGTFPRRKEKSKEDEPRKRGRTIIGGSPFDENRSPLLPKRSPRAQRKAPKLSTSFQNDTSVTSENTANTDTPKEHPVITALKEEWQGLKIGALHQRIRRLTLLLELSEPGSIPDSSLLSSLFTVGPPGAVVPKALILLECCLFVHKLNNEGSTVWLSLNQSSSNWDMFYLLRKWGEAIGDGLKECIMKEKEYQTRHTGSEAGGVQLTDEPVFPEEGSHTSDKSYTVNYSLKMMACVLLLEITRFLREPPPCFLSADMPSSTSHSSSHAFPAHPPTRKVSNLSVQSTDSESPASLFLHSPMGSVRRMSSELQLRPFLGVGLEDVPRFLSVEQPSNVTQDTGPLSSRKVSVYLRVNSRYGRQTNPHHAHGPAVHSTHGPASIRRPGSSYIKVPGDTYRVTASPGHQSPVKQQRRMSAAFSRQVSAQDTHVSRHAPSTGPRHRKSFSGSAGRDAVKKDSASSHTPATRPHLSPPSVRKPIGSTHRRRPSVISRFIQRGRHAFRRPRGVDTLNRKRPSTATQTSSANSSPSFAHRRMAHSRQDSVSFQQRLDDLRSNFYWLDVVEHLIVSAHAADEVTKNGRRQHCSDLMSALKRIYSIQFCPPDPGEAPPSSVNVSFVSQPKATLSRPQSHVSINTIFSNAVGTPLMSPHKTNTSLVVGSLQLLAPVQSPVKQPASLSSSNFSQRLAKLDFSGLRLRAVLESGGVWGKSCDDDSLAVDGVNDVTLDQLIETDSNSSLEKLMSEYNNERLEYCSSTVSGLLHAPFSLMTYAGPVLFPQVFKDLRKVAWDTLIDPDYKCASAAASFFLLSCLKEKKDHSNVQSVINANVKGSDLTSMKDIIIKFKTLWRCRDSVWPLMERGASKHFTPDEDKQSKDSQSIGYSLPSHFMGSLGEELPFPSWKPQSVCCNKSCVEDDDDVHTAECYQSTQMAPLVHLHEMAKVVQPYQVSMINITEMDLGNGATALVEVDKAEYEQGVSFPIKDYIKLTLFPNNLLPLITLVIRALCMHPVTDSTSTDTSASSIQISEIAEEALWQCMLDPQDLFLPLLNEFNRLYQIVRDQKRRPNYTVEETAEELLGNILKPFHILLCHFSVLPPRAAHFIFNHFIGIVMRHTEQPLDISDTVVQSILGLMRMIVPSVKGLSMKELKNQLKKENCYTTLLTTARIRGVEKVNVKSSDSENSSTAKEVAIDEGTSFIDVVAKARDIDLTSPENIFNIFHSYYLTDEKTNLPVLSSLMVQDYYSIAPDGTLPLFSLYESDSTSQIGVWTKQLQMLQTHKMSEIARVLFVSQMLLETAQNDSLQRYAEPNSIFIFEELVKLSSFPRKTLDTVSYEVGPIALSRWELRVMDTMLRGVWSKFILTLFTQIDSTSYQPDKDIILFLTVLNGSLLLQSEDHTILRNTLAALLTAAVKFKSIFRTEGYQMIVPSLVQVYALQLKNKMVTDAIQFMWCSFYWLNQNVFLLQAISSIANLFNSNVSSLAITLGVNFSPLKFAEGEMMEQQNALERASMCLMGCLDCFEDSLPPDSIDILGACPKEVKDCFNKKSWSSCSLDQMLTLCATVASYNPEVLRGMQVLVFLDHLMPLLLSQEKELALSNSVKFLIKGCEAIKKAQVLKGDKLSSRGRGSAGAAAEADQHHIDDRVSVFFKQIMFRNRSGTSQDFHTRSIIEFQNVPPEEQYTKYVDSFKNRRIDDVHSDILHISRDSLLSIASQYYAHAVKNDSKRLLDLSSLTNIASIIDKVIRQGMKPNSSHLLTSKGFVATLLDLFPAIEWSPENKAVFSIVLDRTVKLFKKVQMENQRERIILTSYIWEGMETILESFYRCTKKCPNIVDNESVLSKLKNLIDMCLVVKSTSTQSGQPFTASSSARAIRPFIFEAPTSFVSVVVKLTAEVVAASQMSTRRNKLLLRNFFSGKLHFKETESSFVWKKLFLPLAINLGLRDQICPVDRISSAQDDDDDALFLLETIYQIGEQIHYIIKYRSSQNQFQIERFFIDMKVILAAFGNKFSLELWMKIGHEILTLATRYVDYNSAVSISGIKDNTNEMYIIFCSKFLDFMEDFLLLSRLPIYSVIWPAVSVIERQLTNISEKNKLTESNPIRTTLTSCLQKCSHLGQRSFLNPVTSSRQQLLNTLRTQLLDAEHLRSQASTEPTLDPFFKPATAPSFATGPGLEEPWQAAGVVLNKAPPKRRNSKPPNFPIIMEMQEIDSTNSVSDTDSPLMPPKQLLNKRPTTLSLKDNDESPILEKKSKSSKPSSLATPKTFQHTVTFAKYPSDSKRSPLKQHITEEEEDDEEMVSIRKPMPTHRRKIPRNQYEKSHRIHDSSEADGEDSGQDTPRSSFSYSRSPLFSSTLSPHDAITVAAEVHPPSPLFVSSFKSLDSVVTTQGRVSPNTLHVSPKPFSSVDSSVQSSNAGSGRPRLVRVSSIHDQPDEQTGQPRKDLDTSSSSDEEPSPEGAAATNFRTYNKRFESALQESFGLLPTSSDDPAQVSSKNSEESFL